MLALNLVIACDSEPCCLHLDIILFLCVCREQILGLILTVGALGGGL